MNYWIWLHIFWHETHAPSSPFAPRRNRSQRVTQVSQVFSPSCDRLSYRRCSQTYFTTQFPSHSSEIFAAV